MDPLAPEQTMIYWLGQAAREAREQRERKQIHIAVLLDTDQSTIYRFETGKAWPRNADMFVQAYAEDLELDPMELWSRAFELRQAAASRGRGEDEALRPPPGGEIERLAKESRPAAPARSTPESSRSGGARRRATG